MPRTTVRVVCGLELVITTLLPTRALVSVDLPAFGRPTNDANPLRWAAGRSGVGGWLGVAGWSGWSGVSCGRGSRVFLSGGVEVRPDLVVGLAGALPARQIGPGSTARGWRWALPRQYPITSYAVGGRCRSRIRCLRIARICADSPAIQK